MGASVRLGSHTGFYLGSGRPKAVVGPLALVYATFPPGGMSPRTNGLLQCAAVREFNLKESDSLFIVVVLYGRSFSESPTCNSLLGQMDAGHRDFLLVYDNSPTPHRRGVPDGWNFRSDPLNGGLAKAYSYAWTEAKAKGCRWLLLLDQDTSLPPGFLSDVHRNMAAMREASHVVALVPIVLAGDRQVSPVTPKLGREVLFAKRRVVEKDWIMALNSGTCVRVDFLDEIGGFCGDFWLDYLDHWLFRMIALRGRSVYVGDLVLQHDLSVAHMNKGMGVDRYANVLAAELLFTNRHLPRLWRCVLVPRLLARAVKHLVFTANKRIAALMAGAAISQLISVLQTSPSNRKAGPN